ncbi:MAG TPA: ImmA/IrrE family metallo-endopeptidase [Dehalococcoidia bacterium]|nr:ImmA/IrrE family metallo-endopeptidase [Dehalococcoidia bacterium]
MRDRKFAEVFPPGEFIKEELEARGWTQDDLAEILGRPTRLVNELIAAKRGITPETAKGLGGAFGTSGQLWMNLESVYRLSRGESEQEHVARRAALYTKAPIRAMIRRKWLESSNNIGVLERNVCDFFKLADINKEIYFSPYVARKATPYNHLTQEQNALLHRASHLANGVSVSTFSQTRFNNALRQLKMLLPDPEEIRRIPEILSECGVRFLVIEPLPQSKIDGATFWLDDSPVVVLSLRYDRIDWFWYTLMHELAHVKNEDGKRNSNFALDTNLLEEQTKPVKNRPAYELRADKFASDFLVPRAELDDFIARTRPLYSKKKIMSFANRINVHSGIVVGQLHYRKEINYSQNREMLVKIRHIITSVALTDGWGVR